MRKIISAIISIVLILVFYVGTVKAGTLSELEEGVNHYQLIGSITDPDLKKTLDDLIAKAKSAAGDIQSENAYRDAFIDVINAFTGIGIDAAAASHLIELARPQIKLSIVITT